MHGLALHACERCACACGEGSREHWRGVRRAQQWAVARAAGVCGRRAAGARCAVGRTGQHTTARGASTWRFERVSGRLNSKFKGPSFKSSAHLSNPPKSPAPAQRCAAPSCPRHSARLLRACCTNLLRSATCLMPGAHLASFPGLRSPHAHTHRFWQACSPCTWKGCSYVLRRRTRKGAPAAEPAAQSLPPPRLPTLVAISCAAAPRPKWPSLS